MREYVIVNVIDRTPNDQYKLIGMPLHVTLSNTFYSDLTPEEILDRLRTTTKRHQPFEVRATSRQRFGEANDISVTELEKTKDIQSLHSDILTRLGEDIEMKKKQFAGQNYRPHVSDQPSAMISVGDSITIDNLTLFELKDKGAAKLWSVTLT